MQEGLIKACDVIDLIIEILRGSKSVKDAKACLVNGVTDNIKFKSSISKKMAVLLRFTERQGLPPSSRCAYIASSVWKYRL